MPITKRLLKHPLTQSILSHFLAGYIRLVMLTNRKEFHIHPNTEAKKMPFLLSGMGG
jgi:lysophospholipid acyltransferase (LPLAT)-like uncharacterized protein